MAKIQVRRGLSTELASVTPDAGEPYYITDTKSFGIGDGVALAGKGTFSGQWVQSDASLYSNNAPTSDTSPIDISTYLPDDGYKYEVLIAGTGVTGSASGNQQRCIIASDLGFAYTIWNANTRTASSMSTGGFAFIPVGAGRTMTVKGFGNNTGTIALTLCGYRRIGTNS